MMEETKNDSKKPPNWTVDIKQSNGKEKMPNNEKKIDSNNVDPGE